MRAQTTLSCPRNPEQMSTFHIALHLRPLPGSFPRMERRMREGSLEMPRSDWLLADCYSFMFCMSAVPGDPVSHLAPARRQTSLSSQCHLRRKCAPDVSPAQHCATPRSLLLHKQVVVLECGQMCVSRRDPTTVFLETTVVKCRHCDSHVLFYSEFVARRLLRHEARGEKVPI